jgi:hypothetical protein
LPQRVPKDVAACFDPHIRRIDDIMGLHRGLKTLPVIGPMLSRNQGVITLKKREPTSASVGISTPIRSVWSTGRD